MKSKNSVLLIASLLFCADLCAQTVAEKPAAPQELQTVSNQLAIQDQKGKKEAPPQMVEYDQAPEVVKQFQPDYPSDALKDKIEGNVWLNVWIDESGKVAEAKVMKSDNEVFNQAAIDAGKRWVFKPAIAKGKPIAVWVTVPFRFKLYSGAEAPSLGVPVMAPEKKAKGNPPAEDVKVDKGPEPIKQVHPKYPEAAKRDKIVGTVWTKLWVDRTGRVVEVTVTKSDNEILNQAAIDAAKQWSFKPAVAKGEPVAVWVNLPFRFALK